MQGKIVPLIPTTARELYQAWSDASTLTPIQLELLEDHCDEDIVGFRVMHTLSYSAVSNDPHHTTDEYFEDLHDLERIDAITVFSDVLTGDVDLDYVLIEKQEPFRIEQVWESFVKEGEQTIDSTLFTEWKQFQKSLQHPCTSQGHNKFWLSSRDEVFCLECAKGINADYISAVTQGETNLLISMLVRVCWLLEDTVYYCEGCSVPLKDYS